MGDHQTHRLSAQIGQNLILVHNWIYPEDDESQSVRRPVVFDLVKHSERKTRLMTWIPRSYVLVLRIHHIKVIGLGWPGLEINSREAVPHKLN